jgi:hypothetical protein
MRYQPQGRAIAAGAWRSLGLESFTLFQTADIEAASPSGLSRSGTGHVVRATPQGIGVSQNGGNNTWTVGAKGKTIGVGNQFAVAVAFQLNATGQTQKYLVIDGASADQSAVIYGYTANTVEFFAQGYTGTDPRTGSGIVVNDTLPHVIIYTYDGTNWRGYLDGVEKFSVTRTFSLFGLAGTASGFIGGATATTGVINATFYAHTRFSKGMSRDAARMLSASLWQALAALDDDEVLDAAAGSQTGVTGNLSATLGAVSLAATGSAPISGAAAVTLDALTAAGNGAVSESGALAATLSAVTLNATGTVSAAGTLTATLDPVALSAAGAITASGTFASTLGHVTLGASGSAPVSGALSKTLGQVTLAASGFVDSGSGQNGGTSGVTGQLAVQLQPVTLAATGAVQVQGTAGITLGYLSESADGGAPVQGRAGTTLGAMSISAYGGVPVTGSLQVALGELTMVATAGMFVFTRSEGRTYVIAAEDRRHQVQPENRTYRIEP